MIYIPSVLLPYLLGLFLIIGGFRLLIWALRKGVLAAFLPRRAVFPSATGGFASLNPLRWGQSSTPATSLNTILLRTTPGMRLWALAANVFANYLLWIAMPGEILMAGWPTIALSLAGAVACFGIFSYEARLDDDRLTISKWGLFRREYLWRDLTGFEDARGHEYRLHFGKTDVTMPKYLVGAQGFLSFVHETLAGNHARNARTSRS